MSDPMGIKDKILRTPVSRSVGLAALAAVTLGILGAAIYIPADNQFEQRIGIVTMIAAVVLPALVGSVRGDKAATVSEATKHDTGKLANGELTSRIEETVHRTLIDHDRSVHGIGHPTAPLPKPGNQHESQGLTGH